MVPAGAPERRNRNLEPSRGSLNRPDRQERDGRTVTAGEAQDWPAGQSRGAGLAQHRLDKQQVMQVGDEVRRRNLATRPQDGGARANTVVLVLATLVGVWLGWAAPSVSPTDLPVVESNTIDVGR